QISLSMPQFLSTPNILFALQFGSGVLLALMSLVWVTTQQNRYPIRHYLDTALIILLSGTLSAHLAHILLNPSYFYEFPSQLWRISSASLNWHGAIIGGLIALYTASRCYQIPLDHLSDTLALAIPFGIISAWWAARHAGYGIGQTVPLTNPNLLSGFLPDASGDMAPRLELQIFGLLSGVILLLLITYLTLSHQLNGRRLWLLLALIGLSMFIFGFWRGD